MSDTIINAVKPFIEPKSVVLVGVSTATGRGTFNILEEMLNYGFQGTIYAVNPKGGKILGTDVYKSVLELPATPDTAVICTPRHVVPEIVRQCVAKEIKGIIIISQGFSSTGDKKGEQMHQEILSAIKNSRTRIIGPNTLGVINNFNRFSTSFVSVDTATNNTGVICQSGIFMAASGDFTGGIGIGVDIGSTSDIDFSDVLEYMGQDPRIDVVNIHMEKIHQGQRFLKIVSKVRLQKPVLVFKTGTSQSATRLTGTHREIWTNEDQAYTAALRQAGGIPIFSVDEMHDLNRTFLTYRSMSGRRIAIVTISGGAGVIAMDAAAKNDLKMAQLATSTLETLREIFPDWMHPGNPVDIWPAGMSQGYSKILGVALDVVLSDPNVDAILLNTTAYTPVENDPLNVIDLVDSTASKHPDKPIAAWIFGPYRRNHAQKFKEKGRVVVYPTADRAMRALAGLHEYFNKQPIPGNLVVPKPKEQQKNMVSGIIQSNVMQADVMQANVMQASVIPANNIIHEQTLDIIRAYGIPVTGSGIATTPQQAAKNAARIGYPVVLKVISPHITRKSDIKGVKLNIHDEAGVYKAWNEIKTSIDATPGVRMLGVLVQHYYISGTKVILGANRDPQFGPVLAFGVKGTYDQPLLEASYRVSPVSLEDARAMIEETRFYKILQSRPDNMLIDIDTLAYSLVRLDYLINDHPDILTIDIDPMLVDSNGALALDGRIVLKPRYTH